MLKETLLLLPGMMCDERLFAPQIEVFCNDYTVITGDIAGRSSISEMAQDQLAGVKGEINLLGLSMGGIVAMEMARIAPQRIMRLALLDTNHLTETPERKKLRMQQIEKVRAGQLREVIINEMKPNYLAHTNRGNQKLLDLLVEMAMDQGVETFINQSLALRNRHDQSEAIAKFKGPLLILHGAEDELCPPERHRQMAAENGGAMLISVKNAGHISTLENPAAVNQAIMNWLSEPLPNSD